MGIGRSFHARQLADILGESLDLVHQAAGLVELNKISDSWFLQSGSQLLEMLRSGQESKFTVFPSIIDDRGFAD